MQNKNKFLMSAFLLSFVLGLTMISATLSGSITPATGIPINGTYVFNVSTTGQEDTINCTWSTPGNTDFAIITNTSANQTYFTTSNNTALFTEENDVTLTVTCINNSADSDSTIVTLVSFDNADPSCSFSLPLGDDMVEYMDAYGIYPSDASTDTTALTYSWILYDPSGSSQQTSTSSGPNFLSEDFDEIGNFIVSLIVTDEVGKTDACTNQTVEVRGSDGDDTSPIFSQITLKDNTAYIVFGGLAGLLIAGVVGFLIINKSKK